MAAVRQLCWIEFARDGGALAQGRIVEAPNSVPTSANPRPSPGDFLGAGEPPQSEGEDDRARHDAGAGAANGVVPKKGHGNRIL